MQNPTTPGISVEEITRLPNSVSLIDTAIPVFIGYTEMIPEEHTGPRNISSLLEYEKHFGKAKKESILLRDTEDKGVEIITPDAQFLMYYSLQMYFANGGGPCEILSAGNYTSGTVELADLIAGLNRVNHSDEPRLIVFPDAVSLPEADFYTIYNQTIAKITSTAKNWFVIIDTYYGNSVTQSNNRNTIANLRNNIVLTTHAAAYFPHLTTILNYTFDETDTPIVHTGLQSEGQASAVFYAGEIAALEELKAMASEEIESVSVDALVLADLLSQAIAIAEEINETADETSGQPLDAKADLIEAIEEAKAVLEAIYDGTIDDFVIPDDLEAGTPVFSGEFDALIDAILAVKDEVGAANGKTLKNLESSNSVLYHQIKKEISLLKVVLPPSAAMAGVYGRIDATRGVWKAPANVSLNYVLGPTEKVSDHEQSDMNVNDAGSVNAIRAFTGKGTLVWGARTMDAKEKTEDDQENIWKYINVRRYYDMIKLSIDRALTDGKFINEPNISQTWLHAETMIENFLNQQWMDGALAGSTAKEAYHVEVSGDIVKAGTMNITVKIALVRPAEFIVLNFSHQL
ncbi:phage tail sheath family protein [Chryseobacterium nepalense]|uniref:Phage tail sheath subtilisin-like domain-containing protein n=1 Tax=Chryseobacterium nepalense TaxID=1854498 RepID=A0ABY4K9K5_9FLAO|nr:phage tail sheath C-terminal domain-containing protein [Chryseobacterium nepalense]UPQ76991.1 phage tail sheath subtilisin-like domain-containing protein [Chryseobacterium nepalense]